MKKHLNTECFEKLWLNSEKPNQPNSDFWNLRAEEYNFSSSKEDAVANREKIVQKFLNAGLINRESKVLDIGCGSGQLAIEHAKVVKEVVGIDFSDKMLAHGKENSRKEGLKNIEFILSDWENFNIEKPFDFVIASMSPAISNPDCLYKMLDACKGSCYLSAFVSRHSALKEKLYAITDVPYERQFHKINYIFNILWTKGYFPELSYKTGSHERLLTLENAKEVFSFELGITADPFKIKQMNEFLEAEETDGIIKEMIFQKKGELIWQKTP